jgi:hypothetical protein
MISLAAFSVGKTYPRLSYYLQRFSPWISTAIQTNASSDSTKIYGYQTRGSYPRRTHTNPCSSRTTASPFSNRIKELGAFNFDAERPFASTYVTRTRALVCKVTIADCPRSCPSTPRTIRHS